MLQNCISFVCDCWKAHIESLKALACELQVLPKFPQLLSGIITVIQSQTAIIRRHDLWPHRDAYCTLDLITLLQLRRMFVKHCWQSTFPFFFFFKVCRYSIRRSKGKREVGLAVTTITSLYLWPSADFKELPSCVSFAFSSGRVCGWLLWAVVLFYFVVSLFISRFLFYFVVVSSRFCYFTAFPLCVSRLYYCLRRPD